MDESFDDEFDYEADYGWDEEDESDEQCDYTGESFCHLPLLYDEIDRMRKTWFRRLLNKLSKKRRRTLDNLLREASVDVTEWCSFLCPLR